MSDEDRQVTPGAVRTGDPDQDLILVNVAMFDPVVGDPIHTTLALSPERMEGAPTLADQADMVRDTITKGGEQVAQRWGQERSGGSQESKD